MKRLSKVEGGLRTVTGRLRVSERRKNPKKPRNIKERKGTEDGRTVVSSIIVYETGETFRRLSCVLSFLSYSRYFPLSQINPSIFVAFT